MSEQRTELSLVQSLVERGKELLMVRSLERSKELSLAEPLVLP